MKVIFEVEDRDTAFVIFDVESCHNVDPTMQTSEVQLENTNFNDMFDEDVVVWLEYVGSRSQIPDIKHKVIPRSSIDWKKIHDTNWHPVPVPIGCCDFNDYQKRYK